MNKNLNFPYLKAEKTRALENFEKILVLGGILSCVVLIVLTKWLVASPFVTLLLSALAGVSAIVTLAFIATLLLSKWKALWQGTSVQHPFRINLNNYGNLGHPNASAYSIMVCFFLMLFATLTFAFVTVLSLASVLSFTTTLSMILCITSSVLFALSALYFWLGLYISPMFFLGQDSLKLDSFLHKNFNFARFRMLSLILTILGAIGLLYAMITSLPVIFVATLSVFSTSVMLLGFSTYLFFTKSPVENDHVYFNDNRIYMDHFYHSDYPDKITLPAITNVYFTNK